MLDTIRIFYPSDWGSVRVQDHATAWIENLEREGDFELRWTMTLWHSKGEVSECTACGYWPSAPTSDFDKSAWGIQCRNIRA